MDRGACSPCWGSFTKSLHTLIYILRGTESPRIFKAVWWKHPHFLGSVNRPAEDDELGWSKQTHLAPLLVADSNTLPSLPAPHLFPSSLAVSRPCVLHQKPQARLLQWLPYRGNIFSLLRPWPGDALVRQRHCCPCEEGQLGSAHEVL